MKNFFLFASSLVAASALVACSKAQTITPEEDLHGGRCELTVKLPQNFATKATGQTAANESMVQNVQIFVFRSSQGADNGVLDACVSAGFDSPLSFDASSASYSGLSLSCTVGSREVWAVVNASEDYTADGSVATKSALLAKAASLSDCAPSKLLMTGSLAANLNPGSETLSISVRRVCASVVLESVKNDMMAPAYRKSGSFKVKNVYLINVPGKTNLALTSAPSSLEDGDWYARLKAETDASRSALIVDRQSAVVLDYGNSYTTPHTFYSFANDCRPSKSLSWSPRATLLVVEASYGDGSFSKDCYYPITLFNESTGKGLESGKQYKVNLTVRRPGSDDPNKPVEFDVAGVSISVLPWESGGSYTETI